MTRDVCCTACKSAFDEGMGAAPMLRDEAWAKVADRHENLCAKCFRKRLRERGIDFQLASLSPCPFNLFHRPYSWFDMFTRGPDEPPVDIAEWLKAERELGKEAVSRRVDL